MAKLSMGAKPDLAKVHKNGDLKYWPSFWQMIRDRKPFRKGTQGQDGVVMLGYKSDAKNKKFVAEMAKCTSAREVLTFLGNYNNQIPAIDGTMVSVSSLWKENVKESKPSSETSIGGRDTEVYSEILVQFCLAYRILYGERATHENVGDGLDFKDDVFAKIKRIVITPGKFSLSSNTVRRNLRAFSRGLTGISGEADTTWLDSSSAAAEVLCDKLNIPSNAKIFNDKIFGNGGSGDPYAVYLAANTGLNPDKWNPADIWVMTPTGIRNLVHFNRNAAKRGLANVSMINNFLMKQFDSNDIFPISLKKTSGNPSSVHYTIMNSNYFVERISLNNTSNPTIELTGGNRDMKIKFTLETVELNKGMTAKRAQSNLFGSIGKVVPGSQKNIRIKYNANKKQLELEYTQTKYQKSMPTLAHAKMGSLGAGARGGTGFSQIISQTSTQGISKLDEIKRNQLGLPLKTGNAIISQSIKFTDDQYDNMVLYMQDIWQMVNKEMMPDMRSDSSIGMDVNKLKDKLVAAEISLSIAGIQSQQVQRRVIQNLYNACASVGLGSGLNRQEKELMMESGIGQSNKFNMQFSGGIHAKVY